MGTSVAQVFDRCQKTVAAHESGVEKLMKLRRSMGPEGFMAEFIHCINHILLVFKRELAAERLVEFVVKYAVAQLGEKDLEEDTVAELIMYLAPLSDAKDKAVRFRVCQLISRLFNALGEDAEIEDDLWESVYKSMLARLTDKIPVVRIQAINALARLQVGRGRAEYATTSFRWKKNLNNNTHRLCRIPQIWTAQLLRSILIGSLVIPVPMFEKPSCHSVDCQRERYLQSFREREISRYTLRINSYVHTYRVSSPLTFGWYFHCH